MLGGLSGTLEGGAFLVLVRWKLSGKQRVVSLEFLTPTQKFLRDQMWPNTQQAGGEAGESPSLEILET